MREPCGTQPPRTRVETLKIEASQGDLVSGSPFGRSGRSQVGHCFTAVPKTWAVCANPSVAAATMIASMPHTYSSRVARFTSYETNVV